jgi:hypothetical protein
MKIIFLLITKDGIVGEFHYNWQFPVIPRIGENIHLSDIFDEGKFVIVNDDNIESRINDISGYVKDLTWVIKGIKWYKKEGEYYQIIDMNGE